MTTPIEDDSKDGEEANLGPGRGIEGSESGSDGAAHGRRLVDRRRPRAVVRGRDGDDDDRAYIGSLADKDDDYDHSNFMERMLNDLHDK